MSSLKGFAAAFLLALSSAAQAQVNDQRADEIRRALEVWIGQNLQGVSGGHAIELDGQITVMPDGGLYRVTLPTGRAPFGDGTLHFGEIKIDLTPMENGWYDASWRLPDSYRFEPQPGSDVLITIGGQSARGVFAPEFRTMMSLDGELREIEVAAVTEAGNDARLTIDRITAVGRSTEVSHGIYDAQTTFRLGRVTFSDNGGRNLFELSEFEVSATGDDIRLAEQVEFQRRANAPAMELDGTENIDLLNAWIESFADLIDSMPTLFAGVSVEARHGTILVRDNDNQVSVNEGTFSMSMDGLDQDRSQFAIAMSSNGVDTNDPEIAKLLPSEMRFRLAMIDLPHSELVELGIGTLHSMGTTDPEGAILVATGGLIQALKTAGSALEIGPIRLASDIASVDLEGVLRPETSSPYSVVGEIDVAVTGLDALIVEIQQSGSDQDAVAFLTLIQKLGRQAPAAGGRSVRTYAFRLDASGTLLLNGSDIMPLISGMQ